MILTITCCLFLLYLLYEGISAIVNAPERDEEDNTFKFWREPFKENS